ncbi:tetratricopeptide repeat protein [Rhodohalobacter sp.]|uniref:tetratricopeptide repeat protein n=1 Tax=Rhodohalobacter sp. TaxID=1974210 RepID=UPI0035632EAE
MRLLTSKLNGLVLFILFSLLSVSQSAGQTAALIENENFKVDAQAAIDSLYNQNQEGARLILEPWIESHPDHPLWTLWDGMELWWTVLNDLHNTEHDEEFFNVMKKADYEASKLLRRHRDHPDALIIRATANGYTARHYSNREEWLTAANIGRKAYQAYSRLMEVVPGLADNTFAEGMKRYYAAYIPENYPVVRAVSWFLPDGDREEGLKQLEIASQEGVFARPEATYFLGNIHLNYESNYKKALGHFHELVNQYPKNTFYSRLYTRTLNHLKRYREVIEFAEAILEKSANLPEKDRNILEEEIHYWLGLAEYQMGNLDEARDSFKRSYDIGKQLPNPGGRPLQALSAYQAGRTSERMNNSEEAAQYYQKVLEQGNNDEAKRMARQRIEVLN